MRSYIEDPESHEAALEWGEMRGGPFVDYKERQVSSVESLLNLTLKKRKASLDFAASIQQLADLLAAEAKGSSLTPLYEKLPSAVKGYVELAYDFVGQPTFRFIEPLLYRSPYSFEDGQAVLVTEILDDDRSFILNTPRPINQDSFLVKLPFRSLWYDDFYRARLHAINEAEMLALYHEVAPYTEGSFGQFKSFFAVAEGPVLTQPLKSKVRMRYFGHACLLLETSEVSIMIDVCLGYKFPGCSSRYTYDDLPNNIDYLLITHTHQDHVQIEHLLQLRHKVTTVVVPTADTGSVGDPSLKLLFESLGFTQVTAVDPCESIEIEGGLITSVPFMGEHGDLNIKSKTAYGFHLKGRSILCLADANAIDKALYQHVRNMIGEMDVLLLSLECDGAPVSWLYSAFQLSDISWRMIKAAD